MKLSCIRCKQKKLRCDRNDPCDKCIQAEAVCATAERKARVSHKHRDTKVIATLNQRINILERALENGDAFIDSTAIDGHSVSPGAPHTTSPDSTRVSVSTGTPGRRDGREVVKSGIDAEWLDRDLRDVKEFSIKQLHGADLLKKDSPVSQAVSAIEVALHDGGDMRELIGNETASAVMTREEAKKNVKAALELMRGEFFTNLLDLEFMISLSDVITSPHVKVDPAARLVYYNLVFHGSVVGESRSRVTARALYLQCLQAIPAWQEQATGTVLDLVATSILTWTCVVSLDYKLAFQFHTQCCGFAKQMGLHQLDVLPDKGARNETLQRNQRMGFWQLVLCDLFFRLCYNKESSISAEASPKFVHPPNMLDASIHPKASTLIPWIMWGRVVHSVLNFFRVYDRIKDNPEEIAAQEFQDMVDGICHDLETMVDDWDLITLMEQQTSDALKAWAYGDTVIGIYNLILHMDKLRTVGSNNNHVNSNVTPRSLRLSRLLLDVTVKFDETTRSEKQHGAIYMYCIAFYPFRAFFSLYYHVLTSNDPDDYKEDILRLERMCAVIRKAASVRFEFTPIAKAIVSLNNVVKQIQIARTAESPLKQWDAALDYTSTMPQPPHSIDEHSPSTITSLHPDVAAVQVHQISTGPAHTAPSDYFNPLGMDWLPKFGGHQFNSPQDFQHIAAQPDFQPVEYMQTVETQFEGGAWYSSMWNADQGMGWS